MIKLIILFIFVICSHSFASTCPRKISIELEDGRNETYCMLETLKVSKACFDKNSSCELVQKIRSNRMLISNPYVHAATQNPGSWACAKLGFKVLMGKTKSGSDICTCENELKQSVVCISLTY
jgi:hypothetical protein